MKYLQPFTNWRIVVLTVMALVAILLIFCDGDDLEALVCAKAIGIALTYDCWRVAGQWEAAGLITELEVWNIEEDKEELL